MKKNPGMRIKDSKKRGEWAELMFAMRAIEHGLWLSKPWGESKSYDFVVEQAAHFVRIQVKSTTFMKAGGYACAVKKAYAPYRGNPFDFVAAYVIPEDVWYIVPARKCKGQCSIWLQPRRQDLKYSPYQEAWHLLRGRDAPQPARVARIEACADERFLPLSELVFQKDVFTTETRGHGEDAGLLRLGDTARASDCLVREFL